MGRLAEMQRKLLEVSTWTILLKLGSDDHPFPANDGA